ncbi:MAG: TVP38/TMEM64 family protein [Deltaproteobacteria bacterium]|nr:TVP38/TMEM64 family protein [Deltaproteobacteria bacterium]
MLAAFVAAAFVAVRFFGLVEYLDRDRLRLWVDGFGVWGPLVYILVYSIAPSLMMPGLALTVVGGVLFGPVRGSIYVMVGATIGASVAFLIARHMGREWVEGVIKGGRLEELDAKVERQGWKIVAFTRLIPLFPFNFLNYAFGLTKIKFSHYLIATFVFMIPGAVAYVVFSSSILDLLKGGVSLEFVIGAVLVVMISLAAYLYKKYKKTSG